MASESILSYKKPGFPQETVSQSGYGQRIEYVGPDATLRAAITGIQGTAWGDYTGFVSDFGIEPIHGTSPLMAEAFVVVSFDYEAGSSGSGTGTAREISYEIEWVSISRPLLEHPQFRIGGGGDNALTKQDVIDIEFWKNEIDGTLKAEFTYDAGRADGVPDEVELTDSAKLFATGVLQGIEIWDDFAPVARKTTNYINGSPDSSTAGALDTPTGFPNLPDGYEWIKTADRSVRDGGQNKWGRIEEWTGAKKILIDKAQVYWETPA